MRFSCRFCVSCLAACFVAMSPIAFADDVFTTQDYVTTTRVEKPASVANGKVLTFSSNDLAAQPTAEYIKVPVASGDPNSNNTPSDRVSIWFQ